MDTKTIYPVEDAYVSSANAATNYGSVDLLFGGDGAPGTCLPYAKFPLIKGATGAVLWVKMTASITNNYHGYCTGSWTESGLTWNNKPADTDILSGNFVANTWCAMSGDLITTYNQWCSGALANYGLMLSMGGYVGAYGTIKDRTSSEPGMKIVLTGNFGRGFSGVSNPWVFMKEIYNKHKKLWTAKKELILPEDLGFSY